MVRLVAILTIGLGIGGGLGFLTAASNGVTLDGHDHGSDLHAADGHEVHGHKGTIAVQASEAPEIELEIFKDSVSGWNLHVMTDNFRFTPESAGQDPVLGEGHAHVYLDGVKIARLYGDWLHIDQVEDATRVEVTLNSNNHQNFTVDGNPVSAEISIPE